MSVRVHGRMTVAGVRRDDLAADVARVTGRGVRAVKNQLERFAGKTHLRVAFADDWPEPRVELAALTTSAALAMGLEEDIARLTDLTPRQVKGRLNRVDHGKTLVGTVFESEWPAEADDEEDEGDDEDDGGDHDGAARVSVPDLRDATVGEVRSLDLAGALSDCLGIGLRRVRVRLHGVHGNSLVANVFADEWRALEGGEVDDGAGARPAPPAEARPGSRAPGGGRLVAGRYRLGKELGHGAQGKAFEAIDEHNPTRGLVVIKFASSDTVTREFTTAMDLHHDNICQYLDAPLDGDGERRYLVIEHGGRSLQSLVQADGALKKGDALFIVGEAAKGLDYLHRKNVIHHDVSPGNVLKDDRRVRVTDFGIAVPGTARAVHGGSHTMVASTYLGKHPGYAAPEMQPGGTVRGRADQYSLAVVFCSLLEGKVFQVPYRFRPFAQLSARQNATLRRALSEDPDDRFASCVQFTDALSRA